MEYETVIGLEVHLHLNTRTKAFCGCSTEFGKEPNSQTCPVCLGLPGSLPVFNETVLDYAIKVALALNCSIQEYTKFDRKNYFYPDLPKNYQISQYDLPLAKEGYLEVDVDGKVKKIRIIRVHMEEDAGKLVHRQETSLVDYNRGGVPLLEIVSYPDISSPDEAYEYLSSLKSTIEYLNVSDCDMEKGSLRCDANISIRKKGQEKLGVKAELKNMNSFKAVREALAYEIQRQAGCLDSGKSVIQETRLWDAKLSKTISMRTKEEAQDYRYFPEPDLPPFIISSSKIKEVAKSIPELPPQRMVRMMHEYGLSEYDARIIVSSKEFADLSEDMIKEYPGKDKKPIVNWITGPILAGANSLGIQPHRLDIPGGIPELIGLVKSVEEAKISNLTAKAVFNESLSNGKACSRIIAEKNLFQISDSSVLDKAIDEVIVSNEKSVSDYKNGKSNAVMFLVGQVMRKTQGKANPKVVQEMLKRRLENA
ncbi:MAG: Asp-tRNA(Asn)/Glu-tRNA(Gln) amidotransferase subunit GatB [Candidatus Omnitrophota bacterium]|jgi:aspartyl-tRNA(Asn)/glutamyl-tRNA(Gln) amidotransferase subunit B|nr:MAG: Asp-tRNA(Asn)/Glu-tRNA(Gln) amidotransferase subunit GatB [Candidatus Omnitrophota bacterium]